MVEQEPGTAQENAQPGENEQTQDEQPQEIVWDEWLEEQPEPVRQAYERHTSGLKSALQSERQERKKLANQLRDLGKQAEEGSELQTRLSETVSALEEAEAKAQFFEDAANANVANLRVAWVYAKSEGLVDKRTGLVDMARLRQDAPQLFERKTPPPGNAGRGQHDPVTPVVDMNSLIRQRAGLQ